MTTIRRTRTGKQWWWIKLTGAWYDIPMRRNSNMMQNRH
jgi:hypothetical protein